MDQIAARVTGQHTQWRRSSWPSIRRETAGVRRGFACAYTNTIWHSAGRPADREQPARGVRASVGDSGDGSEEAARSRQQD
jgi:hypothetical protein